VAHRRSLRRPWRLPPQLTCGPGTFHLASEPVLDVVAQPSIYRKFGRFGPPCLPFGLPLGGRGPVVQHPAACGCVAPQLSGDGRRRPTQTAGDFAHPDLLCSHQGDLFPFCKRQIPPRHRESNLWHSAIFAEPSRTNNGRHAAGERCVLAGQALCDLGPEQPLNITAHARAPRRTHRSPAGHRRRPTLRSSHHTPPQSGVLLRPIESALATSIRVMDQSGRWPASIDSHVHSVEYQLRSEIVCHGPADYSSGVGV
jgi:hypothetical protein